MRKSSLINRRAFLRTSAVGLTGIAAFGSRPMVSFAESGAKPELIDVNVSLGRWPFYRLPLDDTSALVAKLRKSGVTQAWAGGFDGAFGKDIRAANDWLARECQRRGRGMLVPFGTINPTQSGWEEELRRCVGEHHMPGLRLYPNYRGYKLDDPTFAKLISLASERGLVVQIAVSLEDERTQPGTARAAVVAVKPLTAILKKTRGARVILLNWQRGAKPDEVKALADLGVLFDIATVENVGGVENLVRQVSAERVVFGSHAPFFYLESATLKLKESAPDNKTSRTVCCENARRIWR